MRSYPDNFVPILQGKEVVRQGVPNPKMKADFQIIQCYQDDLPPIVDLVDNASAEIIE